jgi:hypothetical protein
VAAAAGSLIPYIDTYIKQNANVLLIGKHGVGKTVGFFDAAAKFNLNVKYYSASTLDPFTDLVGVPMPVDNPDGSGRKTLQMVRDNSLDLVDGLFFDELNRADPKTLNAVFEIIQFHTINGEPLPNLRFVWAAVNPPDEDKTYDVEDLDPALVDRFDFYHEIQPQVSVPFLEFKGIQQPIAQTFKAWWQDNQNGVAGNSASYISPRRIEKMATVVQATGDPNLIKAMFPPGGVYDSGKLVQNLLATMGGTIRGGTGLAGPPQASFEPYNRTVFQNKQGEIVAHLQSGLATQATIDKIVVGLSSGIGGNALAFNMGPIIEALPPLEVEGMVNNMTGAKRGEFKRHWGDAFTQGVVGVKEPWGASAAAPDKPLEGHTVCITGTMDSGDRNEMKTLIEDSGGTHATSVTASLTMLVIGHTTVGVNKVEEARRRNIKMISETNFIDGLSSGNFVYDMS